MSLKAGDAMTIPWTMNYYEGQDQFAGPVLILIDHVEHSTTKYIGPITMNERGEVGFVHFLNLGWERFFTSIPTRCK